MPGLDIATARLVPIAGSPAGWLARVPHAILFSADASEEHLRELLGATEDAASPTEALGRVVAALSGSPQRDRPPFALIATAAAQVVVLVYGDQQVSLEDTSGNRVELSAGPGTWLTRAVADVLRITLGDGDGGGSDLTDLRAGVLPAAGALLLCAPARPAQTPDPGDGDRAGSGEPVGQAGEEEAADAGPEVRLFDAAEEGVLAAGPEAGAGAGPSEAAGPDEAAGIAAAEPELAPTSYQPAADAVASEGEQAGAGPVVSGRVCGRQHFNDPRDQVCRICGLPLHPDSTPEVQAERPPLGVLVWDSGDSDPVAGDLIVGRDPSGDPEVSSGRVNALTPSGHSEGMSRVHAELRLAGWDVTLADRGSTNGTFVWEEEHQAWHRLEAGERAAVKAGAIIAFGERTATFELPNA